MIPTDPLQTVARTVTKLQTYDQDDPGRFTEMWGNGDWFKAVTDPFLDLLGPLFPLVVGLGLAGMLRVWSGGTALPVVVMIIVGGSLIPSLPPEAQSGAQLLLLLGIAAAIYFAWTDGGGRR